MNNIVNKQALDEWLFEHTVRLGHSCAGVKGDPPAGMRYSDGELVKNKVNIGWKDVDTGEIIKVEYRI